MEGSSFLLVLDGDDADSGEEEEQLPVKEKETNIIITMKEMLSLISLTLETEREKVEEIMNREGIFSLIFLHL